METPENPTESERWERDKNMTTRRTARRDGIMIETPDQIVTVHVSRELLDQMRQGWSPPVQVMITGDADTGWDMIARTHRCPPPEVGHATQDVGWHEMTTVADLAMGVRRFIGPDGAWREESVEP